MTSRNILLNSARILRGESRDLAGSGFVAPHGYLATCAHVVAFALTGDNEFDATPPPGILRFELCDAEGKRRTYRAKCERDYWGPARERNDPQTRGDYALLRILDHEEAPPKGLRSVAATEIGAAKGFGYPANGLPEADVTGSWASGDLDPPAQDGTQAFHALHTGRSFVSAGFSGAPLFAMDPNGRPYGDVIGIAIMALREPPGTAFLLPAGAFAQMEQEISDRAFKREPERRPISADSARRARDQAELAAAAEAEAAEIETTAAAFRDLAKRRANSLPAPWGAGLLDQLVEDILAAFEDADPDPTSLGDLAAELLTFLRLEDHEAEPEVMEPLTDLQRKARSLLGALAAPEGPALRAAAPDSAGDWPPNLQEELRAFAEELLEDVKAQKAQGETHQALGRIRDAARTIKRRTFDQRPNWAALNDKAGQIDRDATALGVAPLRQTGEALLSALRGACHAALAALPAHRVFRLHPDAPELVTLPAGSFLMGSPEDEEERVEAEGPQQEITFTAGAEAGFSSAFSQGFARGGGGGVSFALARDPVTVEQYGVFCAATGRKKPDDRNAGRGRNPVVHVTWHDARDYCAWLAEITGLPWRLPSEAEWEYACRAGSRTRYSWGDGWDRSLANAEDHPGKTTEIDAYPPNAWGLRDMHGNVWEWCEDVWHGSHEGASRDGAPRPASKQEDGERDRVLRGGSWGVEARLCRSAARNRLAPENRSVSIGFRPAPGQVRA